MSVRNEVTAQLNCDTSNGAAGGACKVTALEGAGVRQVGSREAAWGKRAPQDQGDESDQDDRGAQDDQDAAIRAMVDGWPPLSAAQRERLALLLRPGR